MRVIAGVHNGTADRRANAFVSCLAGFTDFDVFVVDVGNLTDRCFAIVEDLYWQIHNDNYLYVIKTLIALVLSTLVTVVEYFVLKKIWPRMREFVS